MLQATYKMRIWIALAITTVSFVLASSATAMYSAPDGGGAIAPAPTVPVVSTSGGFDWVAALIGAAVAAAVIVGAIAVARLARGRGRLAASH